MIAKSCRPALVLVIVLLLVTGIMLGATTVANLGGISFFLLSFILFASLSALVLYGTDHLLRITKIPAVRTDPFPQGFWGIMTNNVTAVRMVAFSVGLWCTFVFVAPAVIALTTSCVHLFLQLVDRTTARALSMVGACLICAVVAGATGKNLLNFSIAGLFLPFISPLALSLFIRSKNPDLKDELNLEDKFYSLMQQQTFEMMGRGVNPSEIPKLATEKAAEIIMTKYAIPIPVMIKIIERAMNRHQ